MTKITSEQAKKVIIALTIDHPAIAQKISLKGSQYQILRKLRSRGAQCADGLAEQLQIGISHINNDLSVLIKHGYVDYYNALYKLAKEE